MRVDVHTPEFVVRVDIREHGVALVFADFIDAVSFKKPDKKPLQPI